MAGLWQGADGAEEPLLAEVDLPGEVVGLLQALDEPGERMGGAGRCDRSTPKSLQIQAPKPLLWPHNWAQKPIES